MKVKRTLIGSHPKPMKKPIPDAIVKRKTITLNVLGVLTIFPDKSPDARAYIEEVLPTLMIGEKDLILQSFWNLATNAWLEFDYGKKTLYLCSLEK